MIAAPVHAATSHTISVSATVTGTLDLTLQVFERAAASDLATGSPVASMAYGQLVDDGSGSLVGPKNYAVLLMTNSSGRKYQVTSTMAPLAAAGSALPPAMGMAVASAEDMSGNDISGDVMASMRNAIMNNVDIYTSNEAGAAARIELWYGVLGSGAGGSAPFAGFAPILPDQVAGSYSSSIQYTIALAT